MRGGSIIASVAVSVLVLGSLARPAGAEGVQPAPTGEGAAVEPALMVQQAELRITEQQTGRFGWSVAIDGDTAVVGTDWAGVRGEPCSPENHTGRAYVYTRTPSSPTWTLTARLRQSEPPDVCSNIERFSRTVAVSGDTIAVGAVGRVFIYEKPAGGWQDAAESSWLAINEEDFGVWGASNFGVTVALDGDTLAVGAPNENRNGDSVGAGAVYVYTNPIGAGWDLRGRLTSSVFTKSFGYSVDVSGDTIVVGNWKDNQQRYPDQARAFVFTEPVDGWASTDEATGELLDVDGAALPGHLTTAAVDGDTIVVAAMTKASPDLAGACCVDGRVLLYQRPDAGWGDVAPSAVLSPAEESTNGWEALGWDVDVDDGLVAAGDPTAGEGEGAVDLWRRPADGWGTADEPLDVPAAQRLGLTDAQGAIGAVPGDQLGMDVELDGVSVIAGAETRNIAQQTFPDNSEGSATLWSESADAVAPTTTVTRSPSTPSGGGGWDNDDVEVQVSAADQPNGSGVYEIRCQLDPLPWPTSFDAMPAGCDYLDAAPVSGDGSHTLFAAAVDAAGNRSPLVTSSFKIDSLAPEQEMTVSPAVPDKPDGTYTGPVDLLLGVFAGSGSTITEVRCVTDPASPPVTYADLPTTCPSYYFTGTGNHFEQPGTHTVWLASKDQAGNVHAPQSVSFTISSPAPLTTVTLSPSTPDGGAGWYRSPVRVTVSATATTAGTSIVETRCALDPATAPTSFAGLPASCSFGGAGALVSTSREHRFYAASRDSANNTSAVASSGFKIDTLPPQLTCSGTGPTAFVVGDNEGTITASVADAHSGPASTTATGALAATDLDDVGNRTLTLTATDLAGNQGTIGCAYRVGYDVVINSPSPGTSYRAGTAIPLTFRLLNASGVPISATEATALLGRKNCRITVAFDGARQSGCPTYTASTSTFSFSVKTPKRATAGTHDITLEISSTSGVLNVDHTSVLLTR